MKHHRLSFLVSFLYFQFFSFLFLELSSTAKITDKNRMVACLSSSCYLVLLVGLSFQGRPTVSGASVSIEALQEHGSQHVLNVALAEAAQGLTANDGKEDVLADSNSNYEDPNKGPCLPNEDVRTQTVLPTHPKQCHSLLLCTPLSTLCSVFDPRQRLKDDTLICIVFFCSTIAAACHANGAAPVPTSSICTASHSVILFCCPTVASCTH